MKRRAPGISLLAVVSCWSAAVGQDPEQRQRIQVTSSIDGSLQPSNLVVPSGLTGSSPAPLVVLLHTWSFDLDQRHPIVEQEAARRGWILLAPNFRGRNDHPEACGSALAQQDILDAVQWVVDHYRVDRTRIYLLGLSGGGHMTLLMVGRAPGLWAAASATVGISDLAEYHRAHAGDEYGAMTRQCLGGPPDQSASVAAEYRARSPITRLAEGAAVPLDIAAGRFDPDVPMVQSIRAFNVLAQAHSAAPVTEPEIAQLAESGRGLVQPAVGDTAADPDFGRQIFLRRWAGPSRLTIFDGGHTWVPLAAVNWLASHRKP